jgi:hypothetical protein
VAERHEEYAVIAGHFGFAAAVKARAPSVPLWALMLACVWMDVLFVPLFAAGIETIVPLPGTQGGYGEGIIHADYTHSLAGALLIAVTFGLVAAIWWRGSVALVLGAVVFSHWALDLPMHHADMPLLPGNAGNFPLLGFGLWRWPWVSAVLEIGLVLLGTFLYARAASRAVEAAQPTGAPARTRVRYVTAALLLSGLVTLGLNWFGM